ncbi:hypothetical protein [Pseudonocardia sp. NPDC046786]|uniref:hypothetical protein n=1 Tax=Pseudonocardia sp. NPDC046786 TaxID=3155471 RepID=UPI0033CD0C95
MLAVVLVLLVVDTGALANGYYDYYRDLGFVLGDAPADQVALDELLIRTGVPGHGEIAPCPIPLGPILPLLLVGGPVPGGHEVDTGRPAADKVRPCDWFSPPPPPPGSACSAPRAPIRSSRSPTSTRTPCSPPTRTPSPPAG